MSGSPEAHPGRTALIWALKIVVSGGLLYLLLTRVDLAHLWQIARKASLGWLALALVLNFGVLLLSAWRWSLLLRAQGIPIAYGKLITSYLVAGFFNNFLPSNIGGDVIRIRDSARIAGSKTLAAMVVLLDRGIGLLGLVFVAALGATIAARRSEAIGPFGPGVLWAFLAAGLAAIAPALLAPHSIGRLLRPLERLHQEWVSERIERLIEALARFRASPRALVQCFVGAIVVQGTMVGFYTAIARGLHVPVPLAHLAILIPLSFIVQMMPVSVNGFGVREAIFSFYFSKLGLPLEGALALSFTGAVLLMLFSVSGAIAYLARGRTPAVAVAD